MLVVVDLVLAQDPPQMVLVPDEGAVQELAAAYHPAPLSAEETVTAEPRVRPAPGPVTARNAREPGHRTRAPQHRNRHRLVLLR